MKNLTLFIAGVLFSVTLFAQSNLEKVFKDWVQHFWSLKHK